MAKRNDAKKIINRRKYHVSAGRKAAGGALNNGGNMAPAYLAASLAAIKARGAW